MISDRDLKISLLPSERTASAQRATLSASALLEALGDPSGYDVRSSKSGAAWSPIVWRDDQRSASSAESVSALVYDLDDTTLDQLTSLGRALDSSQWRHAIHETYTPGRYRLVLPLARDVTPAEYPALWRAIVSRLGIPADPSGQDLARLFYLPSKPDASDERLCGVSGSVILDPEEVSPRRGQSPTWVATIPHMGGDNPPHVDLPPRGEFHTGENQNSDGKQIQKFLAQNENPLDLDSVRKGIRESSLATDLKRDLQAAIDQTLVLKKGERENKLHRLTCGMVSALAENCSKEQAEALVEAVFSPLISRMERDEGEDEHYFLSRVGSSFDRAWEHRDGRLAKRKAAREAAQKFLTSDTWKTKLLQVETKGGPKVRACTSNVDLILENDPEFRSNIHFDDLHRTIGVSGGTLEDSNPSTVGLQLSNWLQMSDYGIEVGHQTCGQCLLLSARRHAYNPVADYLEGLVWDGVPRIHQVLTERCGAEGNGKYIEDVSRKFFIAAAARGLDPGCKVDTVLVLQGPQGIRKTSFVETLAGDWYTTVSGRTDDKDTRIQATSAWFVELSELASLGKSSIESLRGFLTQRVDHIRLPYAAAHEEFQRRCVFVGTTNSEQPLIDQEGNRRFWVVPVTRVDINAIERDRDQLWAEAVYCFREWQKEKTMGVPEKSMRFRWWLTADEQEVSDEENSVYQTENPMDAEIAHWLNQHDNLNSVKPMTCTEVAKKILGMTNEMLNRDPSLIQKVGRALKQGRWNRSRIVLGPGKRMWVYSPPPRRS